MSLRLAVLTDIHYSQDEDDAGTLSGNLRRLERGVALLNRDLAPDLVLVLGDILDDASDSYARQQFSNVRNVLGFLRAESHTIPGNHDVPLAEYRQHFPAPPEWIDCSDTRILMFTEQRAIARQAEAERERRAKVIHADGEFEASERLADAAEVMSRNPATLQLRYLQTLTEISVGQSTTVVFPLPMDILSAFVPKKPPET